MDSILKTVNLPVEEESVSAGLKVNLSVSNVKFHQVPFWEY